MIGVDDSPQNLGILPCSIAWLFKLINDQKDQTGARFSVRVSAVEVTGKQEQLKDLLADVASGKFPEQLSMRRLVCFVQKILWQSRWKGPWVLRFLFVCVVST